MLDDDVRELKTMVAGLGGQLGGIDSRLDGIDGRLGRLAGRLDGIDGRLEAHDRRSDTLERAMRDELAAMGDYIDLRHSELRTDMQKGFVAVGAEFDRTRQLITSQFVKAAEHADRQFETLRTRMDLYAEHQDALFRRQEDLAHRVTRLETGRSA